MKEEIQNANSQQNLQTNDIIIEDLTEYRESKSSASCYIKDITGIIYGGQSSRFWMMRKYINSQPKSQHKKLPFYSWDCITIQQKYRDIDLVIEDEKQMKMLIKFLVYSLETKDGNRGSAAPIINYLILKEDK